VTEFAKVASHSTVAGGAVLCSDALLFGCAYDAYIFTASRPPLLLFWDGDDDEDDDISTRGTTTVDRFCNKAPLLIRLCIVVVVFDDDPPNPTKVFRRRVIAQHAWWVTRIFFFFFFFFFFFVRCSICVLINLSRFYSLLLRVFDETSKHRFWREGFFFVFKVCLFRVCV